MMNRGYYQNLNNQPITGFKRSLRLDGANDKITHSQINIAASTDYTYQIMFNPSDLSSNFVLAAGNTTKKTISVVVATDILRVRHQDTILDFAIPSLVVGIWNRAVISVISGTCRVYINKVESTTGGQAITEAMNYRGISNHIIAGSEFPGDIDEAALLVGTGATVANVNSLGDENTVSDFITVMGSADFYYKFNETGADATAQDESVNNNDGTLVNFTLTPSPRSIHIAA